MLYIIANLSEDKGAQTIKNVLEILSKELKMTLLEEQNKINEKSMNITKCRCYTFSYKRLIDVKSI